jgi:hypothetical protein
VVNPRTGYCQECDSLELFTTKRRVSGGNHECLEARNFGGDPHHVDFFCGHKGKLVLGRWGSA